VRRTFIVRACHAQLSSQDVWSAFSDPERRKGTTAGVGRFPDYLHSRSIFASRCLNNGGWEAKIPMGAGVRLHVDGCCPHWYLVVCVRFGHVAEALPSSAIHVVTNRAAAKRRE
jgi:hypothetical protein